MDIKILSCSPDETINTGRKIGEILKSGDVIAYTGDLGAGKTTLTRGIALGMGLDDEVCSPTFSLVNEYRGKNITLYHFDMYRIMSEEALESTGFYDYLDDRNSVIVIEWSENISEFLPNSTIFIGIEKISEDKREIVVKGDNRFAFIGN